MAGKDGVRKKALKIASGWDEIFEDLTSLKEQAVEQDKRYHEHGLPNLTGPTYLGEPAVG